MSSSLRLLPFLLLAALVGAVSASEPWLDAPFAAPPAEVVAAAAALRPAAADVHVLYREASYRFELDHRLELRQTLVYQVLTPEGLDAFAATEAAWNPWHQQRPEIRARVITAAGEVRELDQQRVDEAIRAAEGDRSERAVVRVQLPGVEVGAVVEERITIRDRVPHFAAGSSHVHRWVMSQQIHRGRLILDSPTRLPLRYGVGIEPLREITGDRVRLVFEDGPRPAAGPLEAGLPSHLPRHPQIAFATGSTWTAVAERYALLLSGRKSARPPWFDRPALMELPPEQRAITLLEHVRTHLQPTGEALDQRPPEPRSAVEVLASGRGSSLDLAALMADLLRAAEVPAAVALVKRGPGRDVASNLPGLGAFDRAIVFLPGSTLRWLDPADPTVRAGDLGLELQARLALILAPQTESLTRTPVSPSSVNRTLVEIEIELAEEGPGRVVEESVFSGVPELLQRRLALDLTPQDRRRGYADYVRLAYRAEALGEVEEGDPRDLARPYRLRLEALDSGRALTRGRSAAVGLSIGDLLLTLPAPLLLEGPPRQADFAFPYPFETEWQVRITAPSGFTATALPRDEVWSLGTVQLAQSFTSRDNVVTVRFRMLSGPRTLTPVQFEETRSKVGEFLRREGLVVEFAR